MNTLHEKMTVEDFETGYFYVGELKAFAKALGIAVGSLRKNELKFILNPIFSGTTTSRHPKMFQTARRPVAGIFSPRTPAS